ncbi:unnamed protein product [Microthlaspi erraticum]|uniref:Uncharacterized protein n=1 Tax=Microthlaspi erraticum TaxID=1685480 RepID=A0A6D2I8W7_9BRAS|nr:unnamed protein product [Microthlaspi erraticum]
MALSFADRSQMKNQAEHVSDEDAFESAAVLAAELISYARLSLKLDSERTDLTVRDCLEFAIKNGIPKAEDWPLLGSTVKKPPPSYKPALVSMKGKVVEHEELGEARESLKYQAVEAKLHVFSPQIELQQDAIYFGASGEAAKYVGLREGIIVAVEKIYGKSIATVKVWYKKQFITVKVPLSSGFASEDIELHYYLLTFGVPCLSREILS